MNDIEEIMKRKLDEMKEKAGPEAGGNQIEVDDDSFREKVVEQSRDTPVIVDFWAEWCTPCLMLGPVLEKIAMEQDGKLILAKMNVDKSPKTSQIYGINAIPAVKIFRDGKVADEFVGALPEEHVRERIKKSLGG